MSETTPPATALLSVRDLAKRYGDTPVFEHVSFDIARGEIVAVLGESGVGKSTLLNAIAGLDHAQAGEVRLDGRALPLDDETALAHWRRRHLGFVFQAFHVLPHLSVAQNVALPLLLLDTPDDARVHEVLAQVGLAGFEARAPRTLSGGQLQRVAIARALVHRPPLVLADEPTGNLDPSTAERVLDVLAAQVRAEGAACLMVTHSTAAAARADRVLHLTARGIAP
jgi:putative ABC transport system ATP-binding protein